MLSYVYSACTPSACFIVTSQLLARLWHDVEIRFSCIVEIPDRFSAVSLSSTRRKLFALSRLQGLHRPHSRAKLYRHGKSKVA